MQRLLGAFLLLAAFAAHVPALAAGETEFMTVTGEGRVTAVPDVAVVTLGVEENARTARDAIAAMSVSANKILDAIRTAGVDDRDVQTSGLDLFPVYIRDGSLPGAEQRLTGFRASTTLTVKVRKLEGLGGLLDTLVTAGANTFRGIAFDVSTREALLDKARQRAVSDALRKAALYAESAHVSLGDILSIQESSSAGGPRPVGRVATMAMDTVPIAAGETELRATIQVKIAIISQN